MTTPAEGYPHAGGCPDCRAERRCNYCGAFAPNTRRCTNGRCATCHARECAPSGSTAAGHGFGRQGTTSHHDVDRPGEVAGLRRPGS